MGFPGRRLGLAALAASVVAGSLGCKREPPPPFEIGIHVESDPGHPLASAIVMKGGKEGPATGADGRVSVKIGGLEGEQVELMIRCPNDFVSPTKPLVVALRRPSATAGAKPPEYEVLCPPAIRHMVVAVRADNGANLPVKVLDRVVGYTDAAGAFTYAIPLHPGDGIEMMLDTSGSPLLTPKNPSAMLTMKPYDDIVTFDQKFQVTEVKKKPPVHQGGYYRPPPARHGF